MKNLMGKVFMYLGLAALIMISGGGCGGGGGAIPNTSPKAVISVLPSTSVQAGQQITVDASGSTDAETKLADLKVRWDYNDDGTWDTAYSTTKTAGTTFTAGGIHTVRVSIIDEGGLSDEATASITVSLCDTDGACNDSNPLTADTCNAPATANAICVYTPVACAVNADCDDSLNHTEDVCNAGGTMLASCSHIPIACLGNGDLNCDDNNALTIDTCSNAGTTSSVCVNTAFSCNTATDCEDNDEMTFESCTSGGTLNAVCGHAPIACVRDAQCNDSDWRTTDTCVNPGQPAPTSVCSNVLDVLCREDGDCNCQPGDTVVVDGVAGPCQNSSPFDPLGGFYGVCVHPNEPNVSACEVRMM